MFGDLNTFWSVVVGITAVITLLTLLAGAAALIFSTFQKARSDYVRQDNIDLTNRVATLEHENQVLELGQERCNSEIESLKRDNARLEELVTQRAAVAEVLRQVKEHDAAAKGWWKQTNDHNQAVEALVLRMVQAVEKVATRSE